VGEVVRIGGNANTAIRQVSSDPDGTLTAQRGTLAIDTTTGVTWRNRSGGTTWDLFGYPPPDRATYFFDDVVSTSVMTSTAIGGGTTTESPGEANHPGIRKLGVAAAGVDAALWTSRNASLLVGGGRLVTRCGIRVATISDGTNNIVIRAGGVDIVAFGDTTDGIYFEYDFATNGDHNWRLCSANNGTRTKTTTGIPLVANTWTTLELRLDAAGSSLTGSIAGTSVPTPVTTNIPTGAGRNMAGSSVAALKQLGAGALSAEVDWVEFYQVFTTAR
jgi:hypothetical protein